MPKRLEPGYELPERQGGIRHRRPGDRESGYGYEFPDNENPNRRKEFPKGNAPGKPGAMSPAALRALQRQNLGRALAGLTNALTDSGLPSADAGRFASLILSRPGVAIMRDGSIRHKGQRYSAKDFATSQLADFVTGRRAQAQNKSAIEGDPGYQQELADLTLARDEAVGSFDDQRRRAILEFGDASFADDPLLGGQASANPFSTSRLMQAAYEKQAGEVRQAANRYGTLFGGGLTSGMAGASRAAAGQQTEATRSLQDLLANLAQQSAGARRSFDFGRTGSLQSATQRLLESGTIHAARAPTLKNLGYRFWNGPQRRRLGY